MRVNLATIDRACFDLKVDGSRVLVVQKKVVRRRYEAHEIDQRSVLCMDDGTVISAGFPKFFNFGEGGFVEAADLIGVPISLTMKIDGSLLIRTLIEGVVHWRTRGSPNLPPEMHENVHRLVRDRYPDLLEGRGPKDTSLLLEFVHPEHAVILKYGRRELVKLGWCGFSGDRLVVRAPSLSDGFSPEPAQAVDLPTHPEDLHRATKALTDTEGVVAWAYTKKGLRLIKFKSDWYNKLHALAANATGISVREYCLARDIQTEEAAAEAFRNEGFDWELLNFIGPTLKDTLQRFRDVELERLKADEFISALKAEPAVVGQSASNKKRTLYDSVRTRFGKSVWAAYAMAQLIENSEQAEDVVKAHKLDLPMPSYRQSRGQPLRLLRKIDPKSDPQVVVDDG